MTIWQILSLLISAAAIPSAPADEPLIAYEGFDYPINLKSISGSDGGSGFQAPWTSGGFNSKDQSHLSLVESTSTAL